MFKGLSLIVMLLLGLTAHAENWPAEQWYYQPTKLRASAPGLGNLRLPTP